MDSDSEIYMMQKFEYVDQEGGLTSECAQRDTSI
jgi:hypothetical protein